MSDVRELPDGYPVRVFVSKEEGWVTEQQPFRDETRSIWDELADVYSPFWPVAFRWVVLFDKFGRTGDEKVSAELRQLEKDLRMLVAESGAEAGGSAGAEQSGDVDELARRRAEQRKKLFG